MNTTRRSHVTQQTFAALPLGAVGGLAALLAWEVLGLPGFVSALAAAIAAMTLAATHALVRPLDETAVQE